MTTDAAEREVEERLEELAAQQTDWQQDPEGFCVNVLGVRTLWSKQVEILESIRDNRETAVASCHESGKTFLLSCAAWWWWLSFTPSKLISTAPGARQVEQLLWSEIGSRHGDLERNFGGRTGIPPPLTKSWYMDRERHPDWFGVGFSTSADQAAAHATKFVGYHSPHVLVAFDEACGIPKPIWDASDGLMTSRHARRIAIGNPTDPQSEFADYYGRSTTNAIRIDAYETPNLLLEPGEEPLAYLVTRAWVEDQLVKWGAEGSMFLAKSRGLFPPSGEDQLIGLGVIEAARARGAALLVAKEISIGVDVARFGSDRTVFFILKGDVVLDCFWYAGRDTMRTVGEIIRLGRKWGLGKGDAFRISVDDTGLGGGVTDRLHELGWIVNFENFGAAPEADVEEMLNRRAELWWGLRDWIVESASLEGVSPEAWPELRADLAAPKYSFRSDGKVVLEPKDKIKERIGRSPDFGDALALARAWLTAPRRRFHPETAARHDQGDDHGRPLDRDEQRDEGLGGYAPETPGGLDEW